MLTHFEQRDESKVEVKERRGRESGREGDWREEGGPACTFVRRPHALGPDSHRFPPKMRLRMNMKLMLFPKKVKVHVKVHTKILMVLYPDSSWGSSFAQTQFGNLTDLHFDHSGRPASFVHRL